MDIGLQVKLLRLIEEQSFFRIGGKKNIQVNVRIIAATNQDPMAMVQKGKFREDLFYRLNVLPLHLPPLRERREDIGLLAMRFLQKACKENKKQFEGFERRALAALENCTWSGNVRELQNVIEQVVVLSEGDLVTLEMLPDTVRQAFDDAGEFFGRGKGAKGSDAKSDAEDAGAASVRPFWQIERDEIQRALDICEGNVYDAARRMEISATTLYRKIEKYGLVR